MNPPPSEQPPAIDTGNRTLKRISPSDANALMELRHRAIRECAHYFGTPPDVELNRPLSYYRRKLTRYRLHGHTELMGVWDGPELEGMTGIRIRHPRSGAFGLIFSMYLTPDVRKKGLGRWMLETAQERMRTLWNPPRIRMNVEVNNLSALKLYQSCGFQIIQTDPAAFRIENREYDVYLLEKKILNPTPQGAS